ncbi:uncharacterized protein LOC122381194 [Amphibalanus amphitrite]|uniref:uncharacterized protein LOC122381194 n=1 Tax=Amphibalanus amphitrite TaxID=1232801 RepID=UPI001C92ABFC|nr:uncharacterized protein LOC122381194 [Amphibalanus amphitrite]
MEGHLQATVEDLAEMQGHSPQVRQKVYRAMAATARKARTQLEVRRAMEADVGREEGSDDDDAPDTINPTRRQLVNIPVHVNVPNAAPAEDDGRPTPRPPRPTKKRSWWRADELAVVADFAANPSKRFRDIEELAAALPGRSSGAAWLKVSELRHKMGSGSEKKSEWE